MIHVVDNWVIDADARTYVVGKLSNYVIKKTGEVKGYIQNPLYYPSLTMALKTIVDLAERDVVSQCNGDLADLSSALLKLHEQYASAIYAAFPQMIIREEVKA